MNWGRCSLLYQVPVPVPSKVYKCFENNTELRNSVKSYCEGNETVKSQVKKTYGNPIGTWCVNNVTNFSSLFDSTGGAPSGFNEDISRWNTSSATNMESMFTKQTAFNQDISRWDVSKVTNMRNMFREAKSFTANISTWDVSKVTDFKSMFEEAIKFNQNISTWDLSSVSNMNGMFYSAEAFNINLCQWGSKIDLYVDVNFMFIGTSCPVPNGPSFDGYKRLDVCQVCA
jgi:surface protein